MKGVVAAVVLIVLIGIFVVYLDLGSAIAPTPRCETKTRIDEEIELSQNHETKTKIDEETELSQNYTRAYFTLVSSIEYDVGAQILVCRLRQYSSDTPIFVLVDENVTLLSKSFYARMRAKIIMVSNPATHIQQLSKEVRSGTYTKLNLWRFDSVETAVYLDADAIPVRNPESLFDILSNRNKFFDFAVKGHRGYVNTGVFVFRPSLETWHKLLDRLERGAYKKNTRDPTEQDLLVSHFSQLRTTKFIPEIYNYNPLHHNEGLSDDAVIVHYIGNPKPWTWVLGKETSIEGQKSDSGHLPTWSVQLYQREMELYFTACHGPE